MSKLIRVGIRDFKTNLSRHLNNKQPITVTNNGKPVGIYLPLAEDSDRDLEELLTSADKTLKDLRGK